MNKPKILMLDQPCEEACKLIDEVAERKYGYGNYSFTIIGDYVWTGLSPVKTGLPVFSPCTGVDHIKAPAGIIHLDKQWKRNEGQNITSTAEHTLSLMLQLAKKAGIQLSGKKLGIIGKGRIGSMVDKYYNFSYNRYVCDPNFNRGGYSIDDIMFMSDIVTLHIPLNEKTKGVIGPKQIRLMPPGALLINTSRQEVVDIEAVKEALISKQIYYADDFKDKVDLTEYGAIQTPHIGGNCKEAREMTDIYIAKKLQEYIRGL